MPEGGETPPIPAASPPEAPPVQPVASGDLPSAPAVGSEPQAGQVQVGESHDHTSPETPDDDEDFADALLREAGNSDAGDALETTRSQQPEATPAHQPEGIAQAAKPTEQETQPEIPDSETNLDKQFSGAFRLVKQWVLDGDYFNADTYALIRSGMNEAEAAAEAKRRQETKPELVEAIDTLGWWRTAETTKPGSVNFQTGDFIDPRNSNRILNFRRAYDPFMRGLDMLAQSGNEQAQQFQNELKRYLHRDLDGRVDGFNQKLFLHNEPIERMLQQDPSLTEWVEKLTGRRSDEQDSTTAVLDSVIQTVLDRELSSLPEGLKSKVQKNKEAQLHSLLARDALNRFIIDETSDAGLAALAQQDRLLMFHTEIRPLLLGTTPAKIDAATWRELMNNFEGKFNDFAGMVRGRGLAGYATEPLEKILDTGSYNRLIQRMESGRFAESLGSLQPLLNNPEYKAAVVQMNQNVFRGENLDEIQLQQVKESKWFKRIGNKTVLERLKRKPSKMALLMVLMFVGNELTKAAQEGEGQPAHAA